MTTCDIRGIPVSFPFEPYPLQKDYMEKVIDCLQNESNGVLESPTGTGKTLALLCSSLAWLTMKKAQLKLQMQTIEMDEANKFMKSLHDDLNNKVGGNMNSNQPYFRLPTIIYASRTHTQLSQAMQELKRTAYNHMKATVMGSRDQMCIHPDILKEPQLFVKIHLCQQKRQFRSCHFYNRVERKKEDPIIRNLDVIDIEDLVTLGKAHKFCPYYMAKELKQESDIIFMPYNYLLDPRVRKGIGVDLSNSIVILDEAHNVDRICEESASFQIKSSDVAVAIEEVTGVMKALSEDTGQFMDNDIVKDLDPDMLCSLKDIFLKFEKVIDDIKIQTNTELTTFDGDYIFDILNNAGVGDNNYQWVIASIEKVVQFLSTLDSGPFQRKGNYMQLLQDVLVTAFTSTTPEFREKIKKCYKVHIAEEEVRKNVMGTWLSKAAAKKGSRVLSFWCFNPGFGMSMLIRHGVKCVILTSGTLAPLEPLITELGIKVDVRLENPHIVTKNQVSVKIIPNGPDREPLNCSFRNRDNIKYKSSLGLTILNVTRMIPDGLLIFFPSYPILKQCQEHWQNEGIWSSINAIKTIFVEPRDKDAFHNAMTEYYNKIQDPNSKGAIFMGVCRGKVSEGLDFIDMNGRGVIIVGLPYPPLKDPKIILKQRYLDICKRTNKEYLGGQEWYSLEATRAVNQAIGRVIRHKDDYGTILLLDERFNSAKIKSQMSLWLRDRIEVVSNFGMLVRDIKLFFKNAQENLPTPVLKQRKNNELQNVSVPAEFEVPETYKQNLFNFPATGPLDKNATNSPNLVTIHKRHAISLNQAAPKRKKIIITKPTNENNPSHSPLNTTIKEYIVMVKNALEPRDFQAFLNSIKMYNENGDFVEFTGTLDKIFTNKSHLHYILQGLSNYVKDKHKQLFQEYWSKIR